jgi:hypothetical protein
MTLFSSPAYATMLSDGGVLFLGQEAKSFHSVLASAILSDNLFHLL